MGKMRAWRAWGQPYDAALLPFACQIGARARFRAGPITRRTIEPRRFNTNILLSPQQSPHNTASRNDEPSVQHDQKRLH